MSELIIYTTAENNTAIEVRLEDDTVWLTQLQLSELFDTARSGIAEHVSNVIKSNELAREATCRKFRQVQSEGVRRVSREIEHYNLDMIISVGYRVNSKRGTQFRQWATQRLRDHLVNGYTLNEKRLHQVQANMSQLEQAIGLIKRAKSVRELSHIESSGLLDLLTRYTESLVLLHKFDSRDLDAGGLNSYITYIIHPEEARNAIRELRKTLKASALFGKEKDKSFVGILHSVIQTWEGTHLYNSIEEQAAHLLYFIIKDHPFADGNKRIGAFLFVWFLERNKHRFDKQGNLKINAAGLTALALLVAQSHPDEKEIMVKLIINLIK